jgi:hypothetical protein
MRASKRAIDRAFSTGHVPAQPYVRGSSRRKGNEGWVLDHALGVRQKSRRLQRDADKIAQAAPDHPVRGSRNMKGLQPFAFI